MAVFLAARGLSCSRQTLRSLCDRVIGAGDIGGSHAKLSPANLGDVEHLLPSLRDVYVAEGGIRPVRAALLLRE